MSEVRKLKTSKGLLAVLISLAIAIVVSGAFLFVFRHRLPWPREEFVWPAPSITSPGLSPPLGQKVYISEGMISLADFAKFLGDYTGITVMFDPKLSERTIRVNAAIPEADREMARRILFENGFMLKNEKLPGGRDIILIREK